MDKNLGVLLFGNEMIFSPQKIETKKLEVLESKSETKTPLLVPELKVVTKIEASVSNKIVIITETFIEEEEQLLVKILAACSLDLKSIELINYSVDKNRIEESLFRNQNTVISFGIGSQKLNLKNTLIPYQIKIFGNSQILLSDSLKVLTTNTLLKKNLWTALQKMLSNK